VIELATMKVKNDCSIIRFEDSLKNSVHNALSESFSQNPNHKKVFKNFNFNQSYDVWVFDGTEDKDTVGYKMIQSYPYSSPVFREGDYIHFDYLHENKNSTFLLLGLDTTRSDEVIGKMKQCTNELRFYDKNRVLRRIPVVVEQKVGSKSESSSDKIPVISGTLILYCQMNSISNLIIKNMRFLLGRQDNWTAWKIVASGINNYMNLYWDDNSSARVLNLMMDASEINENVDDLVNGIANSFVGENVVLNDNQTIAAQIVIDPITDYILKGSSQIYNCLLYIEDIVSPDNFVFTDETNASLNGYYSFEVINGKSFKITNINSYISSPQQYVTIRCQSGLTYKEIKVLLKGFF